MSFHARYSRFFQLKTKSVFQQAYHYLCGLLQSSKANIEKMVEAVPEAEWESIQHLISNSPWYDQGLLDQVADDANELVGGRPDSYFIVDESGFSKKGRHSVGVARQWNGRLGKVDNCQVGVFGALGCHDNVTLTDVRLLLPEKWTDDKERCKKAGIPENAMEHRSKIDLALEIISNAQDNKLGFGWVGADGFYGRDSHFRQSLDKKELVYMVDIPKDTTIYLEDPKPSVPPKKSKRAQHRKN